MSFASVNCNLSIGSISLDVDDLVDRTATKNMVYSSPDGLCVPDFESAKSSDVGIRANGQWSDLLCHLQENPDYARDLLFALLDTVESQYRQARTELAGKMPETFEDLLAVMAGR